MVAKTHCPECGGDGRVEYRPGKFRMCADCQGEGKLATFNTRGIPRQVRARFKALCAERGVTMNDAMIGLMEHAAETQSLPISQN